MRFLTKMSRRKRSRAVNRTPREVLGAPLPRHG
jgi:hypothetical protein